jgi:hypothetical protein
MIDDQISQQLGNNEPQVLPIAKLPYTNQAYLLHEFYQAVTQGIHPATTCQDNLRSLAMVFDAIQSFETGLPVIPAIT